MRHSFTRPRDEVRQVGSCATGCCKNAAWHRTQRQQARVMLREEFVRQRYLRFAERWYRAECPTYYSLVLALAADATILRFLATSRGGSQPNLFFAAVQHIAGADGMPSSLTGLRSLVDSRGTALALIMAAQRNQTNEIGRCALLLPALPPGPLAIVEVGASAGLCLLFDRLRYEYSGASTGAADSPVRLRCAVTGAVPVPVTLPEIVWRRGLDLSPIDVSDGDAIRWLDSCVWHGHEDRRLLLRTAIELARADPPCVRRGELVDDLPALLAQAPPDARLVVFHSAAITYVSPDRRRAFAQVLSEASRRREVTWISNEVIGVLPDPLVPPRAADGPVRFLLHRTRFDGGAGQRQLLAITHPHGTEMAWLAQGGDRPETPTRARH
jgi:hypothetical protein